MSPSYVTEPQTLGESESDAKSEQPQWFAAKPAPPAAPAGAHALPGRASGARLAAPAAAPSAGWRWWWGGAASDGLGRASCGGACGSHSGATESAADTAPAPAEGLPPPGRAAAAAVGRAITIPPPGAAADAGGPRCMAAAPAAATDMADAPDDDAAAPPGLGKALKRPPAAAADAAWCAGSPPRLLDAAGVLEALAGRGMPALGGCAALGAEAAVGAGPAGVGAEVEKGGGASMPLRAAWRAARASPEALAASASSASIVAT